MAILKDLSTEFLGLVDTVVTAVVVDVDVVRPSELFEVTLGGNSLFAIGMFLMAAVVSLVKPSTKMVEHV